jgi:cytidine deaminase
MVNAKKTRLSRAEQILVDAAVGAMKKAYAPYSKFRVGAALEGEDGLVYLGCNVENASYGATVCAERNAVSGAVVDGCKSFTRLAIATRTSPPSPPCGLCRQVLAEFSPDLKILLTNPKGEVLRTNLRKLLPMNFDKAHM